MDGQTLYFSVFATTTSATSGAWRLNLAGRGRNVFIENSATGWSLNEYSARPVASSATLALNTPTLLVVRVDFVAGAGDVFQLWVNPVLGATLGAPNATLTTAVDFSGLTGCSPRPAARGVETQCLSPPSPPPPSPTARIQRVQFKRAPLLPAEDQHPLSPLPASPSRDW